MRGRFPIDEECLIKIISELYKVSPAMIDIKLLATRFFNKVYLIIIPGVEPKILKIGTNLELKRLELGRDSLIKESKILQMLYNQDIPVPNVDYSGIVDGNEFIIISFMKGIPIDNVFWTLTGHEQQSLLNELTLILKKIYSIQISTMNIKSLGIKKSVSWKDYLTRKLRFYVEENPHTTFKMKINNLIDAAVEIFPNTYSANSLIHNDLGLRANNILVHYENGWKIAGILDWERYRLGDPIEELCRLEFEIMKSWIVHSIERPHILLPTELLESNPILSYFEDGIQSKLRLDWYKDYVMILPTKWYLMN